MASPAPDASPPPSSERPARRARPWAVLAVAAVTLLPVIFALLPAGDRIVFDGGLELLSASAAREASREGRVQVTLRFRAAQALPRKYAMFVHAESTSGELGACRMSAERAPTPPATGWIAGSEVIQELSLPVRASCALDRLELRAGLYDPASGERLPLREPLREDQRVFVGFSDVVEGAPNQTSVERTASELLRSERLETLSTWFWWLLAIGAASLGAAVVYARGSLRREGPLEAPYPRPWLAELLPALPFLLGVLVVLEFVKDDAYISFRYAYNLVHGQGLVFNPGERLEGITNFLWVLVLAPFEALDLDLFQVCELLGSALGIGCLVLTVRFTRRFGGERRDLSQLWGALWLATSSSFVLYAKSGLEQPLAAFLPLAGAYVLYRARERATTAPAASSWRAYLSAGLLLGAGCMTRPELHLMTILVALPLAVDVARRRRVTRDELSCAAGVLAVTAPSHLFRYLYYGTLVPNTFYVKTGTGSSVWWHGLNTLYDMFGFNWTGLLIAFAPLAFASPRRLLEKATFALIAVSFLIYYARVGVDEMHWHRLYIPALPFACVLAASGVQNVLDLLAGALRGTRGARLALSGVGWAAVLWLGFDNFMTTYAAQNGFDGHGDLAGTYHPDLGKFLVRHERPGGLVAFQDMGSTPYHAPDLSFLDFFGLVDGTVAHARHDYGLHTFISGDAETQRKYDRDMREYYFRRNPEWAILTIYTPQGDEQQVGELFERDPTGGAFGKYYRHNEVQFDLWDDPRFRQRYVPVRTWPRSSAYYLALWRRRDLWEQTPREVVLDAPPARAGRVIARFEGGLELLGSELTPETLERHEAFVTTWWRLPGPMADDLTFFIHVRKRGLQVPADHVPGDWMYPAPRWKAGEILEDRTLFQVPPEVMTPGVYQVYAGVYRRKSGERLAIIEGRNDGDQRVLLGQLRIRPLRPLIHELIPRTDVETMRAHPERIIDPKRSAVPTSTRAQRAP